MYSFGILGNKLDLNQETHFTIISMFITTRDGDNDYCFMDSVDTPYVKTWVGSGMPVSVKWREKKSSNTCTLLNYHLSG